MTRPSTSGLHQALAHPQTDKRLEILRAVGTCGSISAAARQCGVSYKAAWQALDTLSNLAGTPLLDKAVGGSGGGGARLSAAGEQLLQAAGHFEQARLEALSRLPVARAAQAAPLALGLGLRTSMRNQLPCSVQALRSQAGAVCVRLALADGNALQARITRESAQLLALVPGLALLALIKATAVDMRAAPPEAGAGNCLAGEVQRASRARAGGEVALRLPGGAHLVGFAGPASGLRLRGQGWACFPDSAVVLALLT